MDAREYFGDRFFERRGPEPETFPTFEQWVYMHTVAERRAIERIVAESIRESAAARGGPLPDGVPVNASIVEAWRTFHGSPRRGLKHTTTPGTRRFLKPRVGSEDPSAIPDWMRERMRP